MTEVSDSIELDLNELGYLARSLTLDDPENESKLNIETRNKKAKSLCIEQSYGNPLSSVEASRAVPIGNDGLIRYALVVPDNFCKGGELLDGLNPRDYDLEKATIKPRRATLPIKQTDLMSSLTKVDDGTGSRYIFNGVLNGWPSLRHFELIGLEKKRSTVLPGGVQPPEYIMNSIGKAWKPHWSSEKEGKKGIPPAIMDGNKIYRATLRGPPWSSLGWSQSSPGFVFWFQAQHSEGPRVLYGSDIVSEMDNDTCIAVHMISHRYATLHESPKDKLTYHSLVFLEWENSPYCTIVEGAFLNGVGGYKGKCNWYDDKNDEVTELYKALPPEMISPWLTTAAELRCYDVEAKNLDEIKKYIDKYTGPSKRFLDPQYTFSHATRLSYRSRSNIAQYLLNYISRNCSYSEISRNCQTFAADFCCFLAGKKDVTPYHPVNKAQYYNKAHLFLYDSNMYIPKKGESLKGKVAK